MLLVSWGAIGLALLAAPPLARLHPGAPALPLAALALLPVALLLWAEWAGAAPRESADPRAPVPPRTSEDFSACAVAALVAAGLYTAIALTAGAPQESRALAGGAVGLLLSLLLHLLLFMAAFCFLTLLRGVTPFFVAGPRRAELVLATLGLAALFAAVVRTLVLPGLSFEGEGARAVGTALGLATALAIAVRGAVVSEPELDGVARVLTPLVPAAVRRSGAACALWFLALGLAAAGVCWLSNQLDFNRLLSRLGVMAVWLLVWAACLHRPLRSVDRSPSLLYLGALVVLALHVALARPAVSSALSRLGADLEGARSSAVAADPSFRLLHEWLEPPANEDFALFALLRQHTNISRSLEIAPAELSLARLEGPPAEYRPHVFLFVIDSLRRDYLSPYNPAVDFTPEIGRFAAESSVFENAYTRYGATGLSIPALWIGAPLLHKQYVTPFAPMNTLAKLLAHEGYAQWVGMDNIMDVILPASEARRPLDADRMVKDFRFCQTLGEIRERLAARAADDPPVFVYSLPQDIHVSVLAREGGRSVDDADYPGFSASVASRVRRFDACFGDFLADLRQRGLYDDSLIVLTSDHGDSLGEEGRIGHAYGLFPEVIRIPLIVSLPARLAGTLEADPAAPAYNTDVTPTLYQALGHALEPSSPLFGRPLFRPPGEPPVETGDVMVASSYGAVYGALLDEARRLYIIDTVNVREYGYALDREPLGRSVEVDAGLRRRGQAAIRETIGALAELHDYRPEP